MVDDDQYQIDFHLHRSAPSQVAVFLLLHNCHCPADAKLQGPVSRRSATRLQTIDSKRAHSRGCCAYQQGVNVSPAGRFLLLIYCSARLFLCLWIYWQTLCNCEPFNAHLAKQTWSTSDRTRLDAHLDTFRSPLCEFTETQCNVKKKHICPLCSAHPASEIWMEFRRSVCL